MDVRYITINEEDLKDLPIVDGQIIALADTPRWYYDMNDIRYDASRIIYCSYLPSIEDALSGVIYILEQDSEESSDILDGAYLFLNGRYIKISQIYNPASQSELGLVKIGANIEVTSEGLISISPSRIRNIVGIASTASTGIVKIGSGINVDQSGLISVPIDKIAEDVLETIKTDPSVFPLASKSGVGVVKIGDNINVSNGLISISSQNIIDALGYVPGTPSSTASAGSFTHPAYVDKGLPSSTGYYLDVWTTGNGKAASYATSEGNMTTAAGTASHAEGYKTYSPMSYSHAQGSETTASGVASHAEGYKTYAKGSYSYSGGYQSTASGNYSLSRGYLTKSTGNRSIALGLNSESIGEQSVSIGNFAVSDLNNQISIGNGGKKSLSYTRKRNITQYYYNNGLISTYVYGDSKADYDSTSIDSNSLPYLLTGAMNISPYVPNGSYTTDIYHQSDPYISKGEIRSESVYKPGDTSGSYVKDIDISTYSINQDSTNSFDGVDFPFIINSSAMRSDGSLIRDWTPLMTRVIKTSLGSTYSHPVKRASTLVSGLIATDVQPVIYCESRNVKDVHILTLPDKYGSLVIFRSWYTLISGPSSNLTRHTEGNDSIEIYYVVPSHNFLVNDGSGIEQYHYSGCIAAQLGYVNNNGGDYIGKNWLYRRVPTSDDIDYEEGQFAFWCTRSQSTGNTGYVNVGVSCAIYSLPYKAAEFSEMLQMKDSSNKT